MEKYKKNRVYRRRICLYNNIYQIPIWYTKGYDFNDFSTVSHSPALAKCTLIYGIHIGSKYTIATSLQ